MADVASKQQMTALFLSTKNTRRTDKKKLTNLMETYAVPENIQFSFSCSFLHS